MKVKNACGCWTKFWQTLTRWELVSWAIYFLQFNQVVAQSQISHLFVPDPRQWKFPFHWENQNNWLHLHGGFRHFQINQFWKFKSCWCSRRLCVCFAATNQTCQRALFQQLQNENRWDTKSFLLLPLDHFIPPSPPSLPVLLCFYFSFSSPFLSSSWRRPPSLLVVAFLLLFILFLHHFHLHFLHRHQLWWRCGGRDRCSKTTVRYLGEHGQRGQSHVLYRSTGQDSGEHAATLGVKMSWNWSSRHNLYLI